jgi:hypothetical protein
MIRLHSERPVPVLLLAQHLGQGGSERQLADRKGKEIESAFERVRTVTRGKAAIEPNLAVEDLVLRAGNIEVLKRNDLLTTPIAKDGTSAPVM